MSTPCRKPSNRTHSTRPSALFVAIRGITLANSRLPMMRRFLSEGWRVVAAGSADEYVDKLVQAGVEFEEVSFRGGGLSPWRDLKALLQLVRLYRRLKPAFAHHAQAKPVILGCAAARLCPQARVVNMMTGLGHAYTAGGLVQWLATTGYRLTLGRAARTIFENPDDQQLFLAKGLVKQAASELIVDLGIDLKRFQPVGEKHDEPPRVVMPSRILWEKGIGDFVEAARNLKREHPEVRFQIAGDFSPDHPSHVPESQIEKWVAEGLIDYLGNVHNIEELYHRSTIVVLPSYYREGVPRVLLEAAACGVPVITCDSPGCREAVDNEVSGLLVPPNNSQSLAQAVSRLLSDAQLRRRMGEAGRQRVERLFDQRMIVARHLDVYRQIGIPLGSDTELLRPHAVAA